MSQVKTLEPAGDDRFPSLASLRVAHSALLKRNREEGNEAILAEIEAFVDKGKATGAVLDDESDRWSAQSLLDYWSSILYRNGYEAPDATLVEFDTALAPDLDDDLCPYLGLEAFDEANQHLFFGRQDLVNQLLEKLKTNRLLAVVGSSGSGKSSVVLGGLIPQLKAGALSGSDQWHYLSPMVPGSHPLMNLVQLLSPSSENPTDGITQQVEAFGQDPSHLLQLIDELTETPVVLVVDQFEEVFTLCSNEAERQAFVANLLELIDSPDHEHRVVLTMRTDFESQIVKLSSLKPIFEQSQVWVTALDAGELREAIENPAELVGLKFENGLIDALLSDVLGEPAALPLLQFSLLKLWNLREHIQVPWQAYQRLGGGRLALANSADEFYNSLIPEEQVTAKRILLKTVRPGVGLEVTSSRIRQEALYQTGEARDRINRVLDKLIQAHLIRQIDGGNLEDTQVEIAHEALIRNWPRLVEWLEQERVSLRQRQRLTEAAENWFRQDRENSLLFRGRQLEEASNYEDLNNLEKEFIENSQIEQKKQLEEKILTRDKLIASQSINVANNFQIEEEKDFIASVLENIAPHLSEESALEILRTCSEISDERVRAKILATLVPYLSEELVMEVLRIARTISNEYARANLLVDLSLQLPELIPETLRASRTISDEHARAKLLVELSSRLPELVPEALETIRTISDEHLRTKRLVELIPYLPEELLYVALETFDQIQDNFLRIESLSYLAQYLPHIIPDLTTVLMNFLREVILKDESKLPYHIQNQLNVITQFQNELEQGSQVAQWLDENSSVLARNIGQEALTQNLEVRNTASGEDIEHFYFSINQFLETLSHCLKWGRSNILENPEIPLVFNVYLYEAAFRSLEKLLPQNLPASGVEQFKTYVNYLLYKLPTYQESLDVFVERIQNNQYVDSDLKVLKRLVTSNRDDLSMQVGRYNISIGEGQNIQIGDRAYHQLDDAAVQALVRELQKTDYLPSDETCQNLQTLNRYLESTLRKLRQQGCLEIRQDVVQGSRTFGYTARIEDFELPFGPISMRGEAFFIFSEFGSIQMSKLRQFSGQALQWAKTQTNPAAVGAAVFNFRVPTHLCFAIALVDEVDTATQTAVRTTNPFDHRLDLLWYEVPIIYELSKETLYSYDQPSGFLENFKGEIAWKRLRVVIQHLLAPDSDRAN